MLCGCQIEVEYQQPLENVVDPMQILQCPKKTKERKIMLSWTIKNN